MGLLRLFLPQFSSKSGGLDLTEDSASLSSFQMKMSVAQYSTVTSLLRPKEFLAELLGTFMMVVVSKSAGVSLSVMSGRDEISSTHLLLPVALAAGLGVMIGILVTGTASGAHMNPCVSLAMSVWGRLPASALPAYFLGQILGAAAGCAAVLFLFSDTINEVGAGVVASYPVLASTETRLSLDQGVATFLLLNVICSVEDQGHSPPALLVGLSVATITLALGANAGASMNPAVDFIPRAVAAIWTSSLDPFHKGGHFWLVPLLVPFLGAVIGVIVYQLLVVSMRQDSQTKTRIKKAVQFSDKW